MTFGIIAMILVGMSWIVWGIVAGAAPRRNLNMGLMVAASGLLGGLVSLPIALKQGVPDFTVAGHWQILLLVFIGGIFNFGQLQFMSRAMKHGPNGIVWSIVQCGFICPFVLGVLLFGEPLRWSFILAVLLVVAALVIYGLAGDNNASGKWFGFTMLSFLATCCCQSFQYIPSNLTGVEGVSSVWRTLAFFVGLLGGFFIALACSGEMRSELMPMLKNKYTWIYTVFIVVVEIGACYWLLYPGMDALAKANVGAISTQLMTASSIIIFELYAVLMLKEKRSVMQYIAFACCLLSIAAVCC